MSTPMHGLPEHLLFPINANGDGPADPDEMVGYVCWCGDRTCMRWLARVWDEAVNTSIGLRVGAEKEGLGMNSETVTDAIKAGARAMAPFTPRSFGVLHADSRVALRATWPILSAPLRELHVGEERIQGVWQCLECGRQWPCPTIRLIEQTDKELGL